MRIPASCVLGVILVSTGPGASAQQAGPAAPIIIQVSDCKLADKPLETKPAKEILSKVVGDELEAISPVGEEAWVNQAMEIPHPFLAAAHFAFAEHRPLALSPDMIWQLLIQQAAQEVHAKPEAYRELFAIHEHGKRTLSVTRNEFALGNPGNDWPGVIAEFDRQIVQNAPDSPVRDFGHRFSTSNPTDLAARRAIMLNAASEFYAFYVATMCGIPRIELQGDVNDWRWLRSHAADLKRFNMKRRLQALAPVLDEFVAAAEGKANPQFWRSFYKYASGSGGSHVSGWINLFFISEADEQLDIVLDPKFSWINSPEGTRSAYLALAKNTAEYKSSGVVAIDFIWNHLGDTYPMRIEAGFMGVSQDAKSLTLKSCSAWRVTRSKLSAEERRAVDFLSRQGTIDGIWMYGISRGFSLDQGSGRVRLDVSEVDSKLDAQFWKAAFPLMHRTKTVNISALLADTENLQERLKICNALLVCKSVTLIHARHDLDPECLKILQSRKDWEVQVEKEE